MGLASKLAASQGAGGYPSSGTPSQGGYSPQLQSGQKPSAYPGQGQYQAYPGSGSGQQSQYAPQQQGGYPPPPRGGYPPQSGLQNGGASRPQGRSQHAEAYKQLLQACIQENRLQALYPANDPRIDMYANKATAEVDQLCQKWRLPQEIGQDIVKLALYDVILYIDNSGSMQFEDNGERIKDLQLILARVSYAASLFDDDGIQVRFMNREAARVDPRALDGIRSEQQAEDLVARAKFSGLTPLGTELRAQIIEPLVIQKARSGQLRKPMLIITITDGQPAGEGRTGKPHEVLYETIRYTERELSRTPYGKHACMFQFAQVGNDQAAREFLAELDKNEEFGDVVDCTSNFENEQEEMAHASPPVDLTPDLWLVKLMLGAIDSSYDTQDEKSSQPVGGQGYGAPPGQYGAQYGGPPPSQYGAPPPGQYGTTGGYSQQQGSYPPQQQGGGQPPQQGYGYGQSPQPGYGQPPQQAYSRPPPQYPQQGGYPPQQSGGYPPPQRGNAPPPPPRY